MVGLWKKVDVGFGLGLMFGGVGGWRTLWYLLVKLRLEVDVGFGLRLMSVGVGVGPELGFRSKSGFGFGLELGVADGLD